MLLIEPRTYALDRSTDRSIPPLASSSRSYDGVTTSTLESLLISLGERGVTIFAHPHAMTRMGAKDSLVKIRSLELGKADTFCYRSREEIWSNFPRTLAKGSRVLKQNRGSQVENRIESN